MRTAGASLASRAVSVLHRVDFASIGKILVVEEEKETCQVLRNFLEDKGYEVAIAGTCARAEQIWCSAGPDLAILDYSLPDGNALALIPRLKGLDSSIPIIILTGYGSIDLAIEALKLGAEHFLPKPAELAALHVVIQRCLENQRRHRCELAEKARSSHPIPDFFLGVSDCMQALSDLARKAALSDTPVLIQGEAGAGRKTLARWLHQNGPRALEPFVDLRCAGSSRCRIESELFGNGDALAESPYGQPGLLEIGHRGTVFIEGIQSLDRQTQPLLRKVVEEKQLRRLGEIRSRSVDIRLIGATRHGLALSVPHKAFRGDLHDRIGWLHLSVPPLRERPKDIPILCAHILQKLAAELGTGEFGLGRAAEQALQRHSWPGNVRELKNALELAALTEANSPSPDQHRCLDEPVELYLAGTGHGGTLEEMERHYIRQVLRKERGRVRSAALTLGIPRSSLYHRLKQYKSGPSKLWPIS